MVEYNSQFNVSGKFPTESNFWDEYKDTFIAGDGITKGYGTILAEQVFRPLQKRATPFYNQFAGRPLNSGDGWQTNAIYKTNAKHFKPKATAQDAFGFTDSQGLQVVHRLDVAGWREVTLPSELASITQFLNYSSVGQLNSMLVDNMIEGYQADMESAIGLKAISTTKASIDVDLTDYQGVLEQINELAIKMRSENNHYNDLTEEQNQNLVTYSDDLVCFIDALTLVKIRESFKTLPNPSALSDQCRFIPVYSGMPKPITTEEFNQSFTDDAGTTITWDSNSKPVAVDQPQPIAWIASTKRVEYRPLIGSYRMNLGFNPAGDFNKQHLIWRGAVGINPFENAVRINASQ